MPTITSREANQTRLSNPPASFYQSAIPADVRSAEGLKGAGGGTFGRGAIAFSMRSGSEKAELVWDRTSDTLWRQDGDSYVKTDAATKDALVGRISERGAV
jgi:hypothetical protein